MKERAPTDEERAFELSRWAGTGGAALHLQWLAHEVDLWVRQELFRRPLAVFARALLAGGELDGKFVHKLIAEATQTVRDEMLEEANNA